MKISKKTKKIVTMTMSTILIIMIISGCYYKIGAAPSQIQDKIDSQNLEKDFTFTVHPETLQITVDVNGVKEQVAEALPPREVADFKETSHQVSWTYPQDKINVTIKKEKTYLDVKIQAKEEGTFTWPAVNGESYILPISEGKYIPSKDENWIKHLSNQTFTLSEWFSMQFFTVNKEKYSILYVIENMFNNTMNFNTDSQIKFAMTHKFPRTNPQKEYGFRIYITEKNPVDIARVYKKYLMEKGKFATLEEKAHANSNIRKLYGAPHIYLWDREFITPDNIHWEKLRTIESTPEFEWIKTLMKAKADDGAGAVEELENSKTQAYVSEYQKNAIVKGLNQVLMLQCFYNETVFQNLDERSQELVSKRINTLNQAELYELNKRLLKSVCKDSIDPIEKWGNGNSIDLLTDIHQAGITMAWLGFPDWTPALINPEFVKQANEQGYLIAPYDSYHSIHEKADENWITASFKDNTLYENATVTNQQGKKISGFLGRGRQLNPTLSLPSVKERVEGILNNGTKFNSWFVDCDAAGEFFDDYSPKHITSQQEDMLARLGRMKYIGDAHNMVVGSEQGNDYASQVIAFAHGLETPFIWSDPEMKNKESQYYVGEYWSAKGGVPSKFAKQVPLKDQYKPIYIDPVYSLPLFKLVYNNSVITSHHWEWGSLKISNEVENRMLSEVLYNIPPLYHLDKKLWKDHKALITSHLRVWSPFHRKAVTLEMTNFKILSEDRLVQMTEFGQDLRVITNFSDKDFVYKKDLIKAKSLIIYDSNDKTIYTPQ